MTLLVIYFIYLKAFKTLSLQHAINRKINNEISSFFFVVVLSPQHPMCILHLYHISSQTSHGSDSATPDCASLTYPLSPQQTRHTQVLPPPGLLKQNRDGNTMPIL